MHGADDGTLMTHTAMVLGEMKWLDAVTEEEYKKRAFKFPKWTAIEHDTAIDIFCLLLSVVSVRLCE